tara:strand:+ start:242 stop:592 length:351 start_codon:yes stop_codon:yes gene_type:complete
MTCGMLPKVTSEDVLMKTVLMTVLICLAFNVSAACPVARPGELPVLPDGAIASEEEMFRAQLEAEKYLLQARAYMDCDVMNRRQHLALVERLEDFSRIYDEEVIEYRIRSNIIAEK